MDTSTYVYDSNVKPIDSIEFSIWGNEEIRESSVLGKDSIGIDIPDLYNNMEPKKGGLIDTRLGTGENHIDCATCGLSAAYCVGHFGHITLAEPVFHLGYINFVKKILSCICLKCSKLLVYKNEDEYADMLKNKSGRVRFAEIRNIAKNVMYCQKVGYGCGTPVSKIKLEIKKKTGAVNIISETSLTNIPTESGYEGKKKVREILTPSICYNILKNISDMDCMILGLDPKKSRPEDMIHKIFPVSPVAIRPSAKADFLASSTMEDDLTHKLADIIKANIRIRKYKESLNDTTARYTQDHVHLLQYHIATHYDNDSLSMPRSEQRGKQTKSLSSRLKGKQGRIRGNLMGKRVDFSARTVITPDPTIDINQLGVPLKVAMNLTFPEVVTPENIGKLQKLVKNGRNVYPGANFVFPISRIATGKKVLPIDLRYRKEEVELRYGDIVERHIVDNDFVLLNRQPTLHKLSMMGHRIKVINNPNLSTFRLNVAVTTPYNADFDGDEMNVFVPQSEQSMIELAEIADVKRQLISPRTSTPIIGIVQDGMLGAYNLTSPNMRIDWRDAMNIISYTTIDDFSAFKKGKEFTGSELFSLIIPNNINTKSGDVEVKNGILTSGRIKKAQLGSIQQNSLIHLVWDEYGMDATKEFIDNTQRLVNNFNLLRGFTVGIGDVEISPDLEIQMNKLFETKKLEVQHLITEMENNPDLMDLEIFEQTVYSELNTLLGDSSKLIMNNLKEDNNFAIMINSGAKGKPDNMGQMAGCVGQTAVEGNRILKKLNGRTLPYYYQNDDSALARGFVQEPFLQGTSPQGFIFHNMGSREGLIDTAIKTASSGYIQRKLIKSMEDAMVKYDLTVRNANNTVIQFIYGDNSIDTTRQYRHTFDTLKMGNKEMADKYKFTQQELKNFSKFSSKDNDENYKMLLNMRNNIRRSLLQIATNQITMDNRYMLPVNFYRIINSYKNRQMTGGKLEPDYVLERLNNVLDYKNTMLMCMSPQDAENKNSIKYQDEMIAKTIFKYGLHEYLSPKICIFDLNLNKAKFDAICDEIIKSFNRNVVEAGEMIGTIAGQSIGEPVTQIKVSL